MDFGRVNFDAIVRKVGRRPQPAIDDYTELHARVAWQVNDHFEVGVKGFNLLNETHREFAVPQGFEIRRSVMAELRYTY
jgi:hypothetical protein